MPPVYNSVARSNAYGQSVFPSSRFKIVEFVTEQLVIVDPLPASEPWYVSLSNLPMLDSTLPTMPPTYELYWFSAISSLGWLAVMVPLNEQFVAAIKAPFLTNPTRPPANIWLSSPSPLFEAVTVPVTCTLFNVIVPDVTLPAMMPPLRVFMVRVLASTLRFVIVTSLAMLPNIPASLASTLEVSGRLILYPLPSREPWNPCMLGISCSTTLLVMT